MVHVCPRGREKERGSRQVVREWVNVIHFLLKVQNVAEGVTITVAFISLYHSLTLIFNFPMSILCFGALSFLIVSSALLPPLSPPHCALLQSLMSWLK